LIILPDAYYWGWRAGDFTGKKDALLNGLDDKELLEFAEMLSRITTRESTSRTTLIETIKGSLSIEEVKGRVPEVKERVREKERSGKILGKANMTQLREIAWHVPPDQQLGLAASVRQNLESEKRSRKALMELIKASMSVEEIKRRIHEVTEKIKEDERKKKEEIRRDGRKSNILCKLKRAQLKELAQPLLCGSSAARTSTTSLIRMISSSSSLEQIERGTTEIRNRERRIRRANQLAALKRNKVFVIFLLSIIVFSSYAVGSSVAYGNWSQSMTPSPLAEDWSTALGANRFYEFNSAQQTHDGGFIMIGTSVTLNQERGGILLARTDSTGNILWNKTLSEYEFTPMVVRETSDGGYIILGYTSPTWIVNWYPEGGLQFSSQMWLVKTDSTGTVQWNSTYSSQEIGFPNEILQTSDNGYIVGGVSYWDSSSMFIVKTNSSGAIQWKQAYSLTGFLYGISSILKTVDNKYVIGGAVWSNSSQYDFLLIKIDQNGVMEWNKTYGCAGVYVGEPTLVMDDGGFAMIGITTNSGSSIPEACLMKMDSLGNLEWNKTFSVSNGGDPPIIFPIDSVSLLKAPDDGYLVAGSSSFGFWLTKTDSNGTAQWFTRYSVSTHNVVYSVFPGGEEGYIIAGETSCAPTYGDAWSSLILTQVNSNGFIEWSRMFGGCCGYYSFYRPIFAQDHIYLLQAAAIGILLPFPTYIRGATCVHDTPNGGCIAAGTICGTGISGTGVSLTKLTSSGAILWNRIYDGQYFDLAVSILQASDGGYVVAGSTCSWGSFGYWLIKTDSYGVMQWSRVYSDINDAYLSSIVATSDGGYIMIGNENLSPRTWVVKVDASGNQQWSRHYYDPNGGSLSSIAEAPAGGYFMTGGTYHILSQGNYSTNIPCVWLVKINSDGTTQWNKTIEGSQYDYVSCILGTIDGGCIIAGDTYVLGMSGPYMLLIKVDSGGTSEWNKTFGERAVESVPFLHKTSDGGYIVGASIMPNIFIIRPTTETLGSSLDDDAFLLVKTDSNGEMQWNMTFGHVGYDFGFSAQETSSGAYIVAWNEATSNMDGYSLRITRLSDLLNQSLFIFVAGSGGATILFVCFAIYLCRREELKTSGGAS
jgi:hypothetical protein